MAKKTLVIVESPAKSHTISKYLGDDFVISSSMGHVRDLPAAVLGIDLKNNYKPYYEELPGKAPADQGIAQAGPERRARSSWLPTPTAKAKPLPFICSRSCKADNQHIFRVLFNEITRAVHPGGGAKAPGHRRPQGRFPADAPPAGPPGRLQDQPGAAEKDRRAALGRPRAVHRPETDRGKGKGDPGFRFRRVLDHRRGICWARASPSFTAKLEKSNGKNIKIPDKDSCDAILAELKHNDISWSASRKSLKKRKAPPPLITSTLQQEAFRRFKFPVKKTMQLAQQLYEGLTHPRRRDHRPDHLHAHRLVPRLRPGPRPGPRIHRGRRWERSIARPRANVFKRKSKIQDAHECIRPTVPFHAPDDIKADLNPGPAEDLPADLGAVLCLADGRRRDRGDPVRRQERCLPVRQQGRDRQIQGLPGHAEERQRADASCRCCRKKRSCSCSKIDDKQNFTKPPARYSEASLVKVLEEKGIGRPSTYAKIIETLNKREYVYNEEKKFVPTDLGINVVDYLEENFQRHHELQFHRRPGKGTRPGRRGQARLGDRDRPVLQEAGRSTWKRSRTAKKWNC